MISKKQQSGRARTDLLGRAILLVEDDFVQARDTQQALQHAGARVMGPFCDTDSALRSVALREPSCAILDIQLTDGIRFAVASTLKERGIPFIFVTGLDQAVIPDDLSSAPLLQKPVDFRSLLKVTSQLSGKRWS